MLCKVVRSGRVKTRCSSLFHSFRVLFQDWEKLVDDAVEHHVEEEADVVGPQVGSGRFDPPLHGLENILPRILESLATPRKKLKLLACKNAARPGRAGLL